MNKQHFSPASMLGLRRRDLLRWMGGATIVSLFGCFRNTRSSAENGEILTQPTPLTPIATTELDCLVRPQQTEGPYFVDEGLNRADIRTDPSNGAMSDGTPVRLTLQVSQVNASGCIPMAGAIVDIWQCDAFGVYSDVQDRQFSTVGQQFLRGSQVTNASGLVEFITIYPGWYPGRTAHIHFKIRDPSQPGYEFTSQLYFDDVLTDQVYASSPYNARDIRNTRNDSDGIFRRGGEQLMLQLTPEAAGYAGRFKIGLKTA